MNYFSKTYGIDCVVSNATRKQKDIFHNEEYYFAIARTKKDETISVWITDNGEITDSYFLLEMGDVINQYYTEIIKKRIPLCIVKTYTELRDIPNKRWNQNDVIDEMLISEPLHSYIRIVIDDKTTVTKELIQELENDLRICEASIFIYHCDDINNIDVTNYDFSSYFYKNEIEKDS